MQPTTEELVLAVTSVPGYTKACQRHGDAATFTMLSQYYGVVADAAVSVDGRVVKFMGDAALLTFPIQRSRDAVEVLRGLQKTASELWRRFDEGCCVWIKIGVGPVVCGQIGVPGEEQFDVIGDSLNQLFKAPSGEFQMTPGVTALLR